MSSRACSLAIALTLLSMRVYSEVPLGPEFQVNTYTTGAQLYTAVASDSAGNFTVVWDSRGQDGSSDGVFARRHNASGEPLGPSEFLVNSWTTGAQSSPAVASDPSGRLVVVWVSSHEGSSEDIFGRQFDGTGVGGPEFRLNTYTTGTQHVPVVGADAAGNFVVVWQSYGQDGSGYGIFAQRYAAAGVAQGPEFRVNAHTTGAQSRPAVAMNPDGSFVVVWQSLSQDGSFWGIFGQRYDDSGSAVGAEFAVNSTPAGSQSYPKVGADPAGNFVVAWSSYQQDGDD